MKIVTNGDDYVTDLSCCGGLVFPSRTVSSSAVQFLPQPSSSVQPQEGTTGLRAPVPCRLPRVGPVVPAEEEGLMTFPRLIMLFTMTIVEFTFGKQGAGETPSFSECTR